MAIIHSGQLAPKTPTRECGAMPAAAREDATPSTCFAAWAYVIQTYGASSPLPLVRLPRHLLSGYFRTLRGCTHRPAQRSMQN